MKKYLLFILFLFYFSTSVFGQITVKGKIFNQRGNLILRPVIIKDSDSSQIITTSDGTFEIEAKSRNDTLIFSSIGYNSQKITVDKIINDSIVTLEYQMRTTSCYVIISYKIPLRIKYWSGIFYNPYGIIISDGFYINNDKKNRKYFAFEAGYSTNFKNNSDFYGGLGTDVIGKYMYYIFQQTTFNKSETENKIATHFMGSSSNLKFKHIYLSYGVGHQTFTKKGVENNEFKNFGVSLGLSKKIKYIGSISAKSFYWQDYWAWEASINRDLTKKITTSISYYQITQNFKELKFILGHRF